VLRQPASADHTPQPTLADINDLVAAVRAAGMPTRLTVSGEPVDIPASAQLALYRMVQEALTNTLKHAEGARAEVGLSYRPGEVELEITDDGPPEPGTQASQPGGGHGIVGMRERAAVFGGEVSAGPRQGGGWRVHTVLRLDASGRLAGEDGK
jgi:signal transduction histidine kinase